MKKLVLLSALALLACEPKLRPLPEMPGYQTKVGRECAKGCQSQYNQCVNAARPADTTTTSGLPDNEAINACRQMLHECYGLCSQDDSTSKQ
jgi:hypothetical protein